MKGSDHIGPEAKWQAAFASILLAIAGFVLVASLPAVAQINGTWPSVTSIPVSHFSPNPRPSVTSLGPFGYGPGISSNLGSAPNIHNYPFRQFPYTRPRGGRGLGAGYGSGYSYSIPYYVPYDASGYGYDYVGAGDYSGPPVGPDGPTLHIVVEQPPAPTRAYPGAETAENSSRGRATKPASDEPPAQQTVEHPSDPTVLVFRDGHKQEISNYAIMGQTVYVLGEHTKKIALAELDVAATVKANDDRGLEFKVPPPAPAKQKDTNLPKQNAPATSAPKPSSIAALTGE